jgi:threonine dehydratase
MALHEVTLQDIFVAAKSISPLAHKTPLVLSPGLSERAGAHVYLKLENTQQTGSFKVRGAANRLLNLTDEERRNGVVTVSTGNHGKATAYVARALGIRAVVCVPNLVLPHKVEAMQRLGAEVVVAGASQDEAEAHANDLAAQDGLIPISPFDDPYVIAGQGTIGLELLEQLPQLDAVIIPLSGGGLTSGIALALKQANPSLRTIGVSMERGAVMVESLRAGHPIQLPEERTLADSLMGGIGLDNRYTFRMIRQLLDEALVVSEDEIAAAMVYALRAERYVVEGGGAVAIAAVLSGKAAGPWANVVIVVSGGNADMDVLAHLASNTAKG